MGLQNELEVSVETLSGLVGRSYLRGSRQRIALTTQLVASRKQRFLLCISRGLVPPETPPALRKAKRRHLPALLGLDKDDVFSALFPLSLFTPHFQDDWVKRGLPPEQDLDPTRPWVKDSRGRHHNLMAILDWPELNDVESDDEDDSFSPSAADEDALRNGAPLSSLQ
jgi:ankyrin repeat/IBR domain-containing protein 1